MNVSSEQLATHLKKTLAPSYLLFGAEPLLIDSSVQMIKKTAQANGFDQRHYFELDHRPPEACLFEIKTPSLFSKKRLFVCHLKTAFTQKIATYSHQILSALSSQDVLILVMAKLNRNQRQGVWWQDFSKQGVVVEHFLVTATQLPTWLKRRMQQMALVDDSGEVAKLIAYYTEGNLFAAQQELMKLQLMYGSAKIDVDDYRKHITQQCQYTVYGLLDAVLQGDSEKVSKIHRVLAAQKNDLTPMLIAVLNKELNVLTRMAMDYKNKKTWSQIFQNYGIWQSKQQASKQLLMKLPYNILQKITIHLGRIERSNKGFGHLLVWDELLMVCLSLARGQYWIE